MKLPKSWITLLLGWVLLFPLAACNPVPAEPAGPVPEGGRFEKRTLLVEGEPHAYQVFVPAHHSSVKPAPVILFLHGSGERGSDGDAQTQAGLGPYVRAHAKDFPAIVVFPQVPENGEWLGNNVVMALAALDAATQEFSGDPRRTYLTGLSMGGYGTWETAISAPGRFAALVPICGAVLAHSRRPELRVTAVADAVDPYAALAARVKHIPTWIFHGAKDDVVPPDDDRRTFAAMQAAGADVQYTEFPEVNHNSWDEAYRMDAMWTWLFAQRRD